MAGRKILIAYLVILSIGFLFLISGYSFSFDFLDYLLLSIICIYPIVKFFQQPLSIGWKVFVGLGLLVLAFFIGQALVFAAAFGESKKRVVKTWKIGSLEIEQAKWQGWAGPVYDRYVLKRRALAGVFERNVGEGHNDSTECNVVIKDDKGFGKKVYRFDPCKETLARIK